MLTDSGTYKNYSGIIKSRGLYCKIRDASFELDLDSSVPLVFTSGFLLGGMISIRATLNDVVLLGSNYLGNAELRDCIVQDGFFDCCGFSYCTLYRGNYFHCEINNSSIHQGKYYDTEFRTGHFLDGTFDGGAFINSTWHDGVWVDGVFESGLWIKGKWGNGEFCGKEFDGESFV